MLQTGTTGSGALLVTTANTAAALGSGELAVLATPAVAALIEKTCWESVAAHLDPGTSTVGTLLSLHHTAPTPVGMAVHCSSELTAVEDRRLRFTARVWDAAGEIAHAEHERFIVDSDRFAKKAAAKAEQTAE